MNIIKNAAKLLDNLDSNAKDSLTGEEAEKLTNERRAKRIAGKVEKGNATDAYSVGGDGNNAVPKLPSAEGDDSKSNGRLATIGSGSNPSEVSNSARQDDTALLQHADGQVVTTAAALSPEETTAAPNENRGDEQRRPQTPPDTIEADSSLDALFSGKTEIQQLKAARTEIIRLRREVRDLTMEVEDAEDRLSDQTKELHAAGEAIAASTRRAAEREAEMQDECAILRKAKGEDRMASVTGLQQRDRTIVELTEQLETANRSKDDTRSELEDVREKLTDAEADRSRLRGELERAMSRIDHSAEALREELHRVEEASDAAAAAQSQWRREAQHRQAALERANGDLSQSLAQVQFKLEKCQADAKLRLQRESANETAEQVVALTEELQGVKTSLEIERQHTYSAQLAARNTSQDLCTSKAEFEEERRRLRSACESSCDEAAKYRKRVEELEQASPPISDVLNGERDEFATRLSAMSDQLLKKQVALDDVSCENGVLLARLRAATQRVTRLEEIANSQESSTHMKTSTSMSDMESGSVTGSEGTNGLPNMNGRLRHRRSTLTIAKLPQIARHQTLARAADRVDRWSLWMGQYLKNNPWARLYFLVYLGLLHSWAFILITFHTYSFEDIHGDHQMGLMLPTLPSALPLTEPQALGHV